MKQCCLLYVFLYSYVHNFSFIVEDMCNNDFIEFEKLRNT